MLSLTAPHATPLHRLPAGAKLAALAVATVGIVALDDPLPVAGAAAAVTALHLALGLRIAGHALRLLRPLWPFAVVLLVWHLWTGDPMRGALIALRMAAAVALANLVTMTTRLDDMIAVMERLAAPFGALGLPPRRLALAVALVIRFTPVLMGRAGQLADSWRARSPRRPGWRLAVPLALSALDDADRVAEALRARGGA
jgi:biotin transport system permease protein